MSTKDDEELEYGDSSMVDSEDSGRQVNMLAKAQLNDTRNSLAHPSITEMQKQADRMDQFEVDASLLPFVVDGHFIPFNPLILWHIDSLCVYLTPLGSLFVFGTIFLLLHQHS